METGKAIGALAALAQETRLSLFRLLVGKGPDGLSAGVIGEALDVPSSSLSFHLAQLMHAGLVNQRRVGRNLFYAADFGTMRALMGYLTENCCGAATSCAPVCRPGDIIEQGDQSHEAPARTRQR